MKGVIVTENAYALILSITKNLEPEEALKKIGLKSPYEPSHILDDEQKEMIETYYYGINMSLTDIAKLYDTTRYTVKNFMARMGIPIKPRGRYFK